MGGEPRHDRRVRPEVDRSTEHRPGEGGDVDELQVHVVVGEPRCDQAFQARKGAVGHSVANPHPSVDQLDDALAPDLAVEEGRRTHQAPISVRTV